MKNSPESVLRRRRLLWVAVPGLLLIFLVLPLILAAPVRSALFRLHAATQLLHLRPEGANVFAIRASNWEITGATEVDGPGSGTQTLSSRALGTAAQAPDRIEIYLEPRDQIELRQQVAGKARYSFALPARSVRVSVQLSEQSVLVRRSAQGVESVEQNAGSATLFNAAGQQGALIRFTASSEDEEVADRVSISQLGFGVLEGERIFAGLLDGTLQFLDKPDAALTLYRGTDLQLGDLDAEVSAIVLDANGIHLDVQGRTQDAYLRVALRDEHSRVRRVMPTRLEWLQGDPVIAVLVGFIAILAGAAGLLFALAQAVPAVGKWLHELRTYL